MNRDAAVTLSNKNNFIYFLIYLLINGSSETKTVDWLDKVFIFKIISNDNKSIAMSIQYFSFASFGSILTVYRFIAGNIRTYPPFVGFRCRE